VRGPPERGCLDSALLAEDIRELGVGADGCARAELLGADRGPDALVGADPSQDANSKEGVATPRNGKGRAPYVSNPLSATPVAGDVPRLDNLSHNKPVMWVHVHKSMGTFIYWLALLNKENLVRPSFNGNWWPHDTPSGANHGVSCQDRFSWFDWSNATWGQIEHTISDSDLCHDHFNYGIFIRDPNELAISKASFENYTANETLVSLGCLQDTTGELNITDACNHAAHKKHNWRLWWFWDNFLVRTLGGEDVWSLPAGEVTEEHVQKVIARLLKFDAVLFMDDFEDTDYLKSTIGWHPKHYKKAKRHKNKAKHVVELTDEQADMARHTNRFNYMVFDYFRKIPMQTRVRKFQ
jgi:hypothetical protein